MNYIVNTESINTGGGCMVDVLTLEDGRVIIVNDEYIGLFKDIDSFLTDDGTKCQNGFSI